MKEEDREAAPVLEGVVTWIADMLGVGLDMSYQVLACSFGVDGQGKPARVPGRHFQGHSAG